MGKKTDGLRFLWSKVLFGGDGFGLDKKTTLLGSITLHDQEIAMSS